MRNFINQQQQQHTLIRHYSRVSLTAVHYDIM